MRGRKGRLTLAAELVTHARIVKRVAESIGMTKRLGERNPLPRARPQRVAGQPQRAGADHVRANTWVMTAEGLTEVTMAREVIGLDSDLGVIQSLGDITAEKSRRPAAMVSLQQQVTIAGALREGHQLPRSVARQSSFAPDIGIEPQTPLRLVQGASVALPVADLSRTAEGVLCLRTLQAARHHERWAELQQKIELAARLIGGVRQCVGQFEAGREMRDRFLIGRAAHGTVTGAHAVVAGRSSRSGLSEMIARSSGSFATVPGKLCSSARAMRSCHSRRRPKSRLS
jgi:hypothetical protein